MAKEPEEIVVREFVGGVADGELELIGPDDDKDDILSRSRFWPRGDLPPAKSNDDYEFAREEVAVVSLRKWIFVPRRRQSGPASSD